jgi:hypothetical protein
MDHLIPCNILQISIIIGYYFGISSHIAFNIFDNEKNVLVIIKLNYNYTNLHLLHLINLAYQLYIFFKIIQMSNIQHFSVCTLL